VGENRYCTGVVQEANRVGNGKPLLSYEGRPPRTQVPIERISLIASPSGGDQGTGYVGPPYGAKAGFGQDRIYFKRDAKTVQRGDHGISPAPARTPELSQRRLDRRQVVQVQSQQMDFVVPFHRTQLNTGDDGDSNFASGQRGFGDAVDAVVIGEADDRQPDRASLCDQRGRRHPPVGRRRVRVKISRSASRAERGRSVAPAVLHDA
jgi:hypothetical protein